MIREQSQPALPFPGTVGAIPPAWVGLPLLLALSAAAVFGWTDADRLLSGLAYDPRTGSFPLRGNFWLEVVMHHWTQVLVALLAFSAGAALLLSPLLRVTHRWRRLLLLLFLGLVLPPLVVAVGPRLQAGHASAGFALLAFYFVAHAWGRRRLALGGLALGISAGMLLGAARVLQGAHLFSHVIWVGLLSWAMLVTLYFLIMHLPMRPAARLEPPHA